MARSAWRLPGYRVGELIGSGSSGEVYRATVAATGVPVALKRIWLSERAQRQAAISEAAMLSALDHPHLMKLHEVRQLDDAIVLVLDLAAAGSLATLLARRRRLTVGETITAIAPIASALAYAHNAEVVHGDVSGANILFTDIGLPLLADLGVARLLGDAVPVRTTPSYADPVVAQGGLPMPASDVFMVAGVALHALTGTPPWPGGEGQQVLELAARTGEQPDFDGRMTDAGVPEPVRAVLGRALTLDPLRRGTAAELALDLRHAAEPVAVELSAGRTREAPALLDSWPLESVPAHQTPASSVPVPPFARLPLTAGVRAPSPFEQLPSGRHLARGGRPRVRAGIVAAVALVAAVVTAVVLWQAGSAARDARAARRTVVAAPGGSSAGVPATPLSPARSAAPSQAHSAAPPSVRAALAALDAARSAAFARRDPRLLARVYASPVLLARDRALLLSIVPAGCGLRGVHTRFAGVEVVRRGERWQVRARMALAPSTLVCAGARSGDAPGTTARPMELVLVRRPAGYRIVSQHRV